MWYFLDKRGRPIEWLKGRRLSNFVRFLLYCRAITTDRPDCMYPCWMCWHCGYVEDYVGGHHDDGNICSKCSRSFLAFIVKKYRPLTEGTTKRASKEPTDRPRPDVKVPSQVAKTKGEAPLFTKRHHDAIIEVLHIALESASEAGYNDMDSLKESIGIMFAEDNPKFDRHKFDDA